MVHSSRTVRRILGNPSTLYVVPCPTRDMQVLLVPRQRAYEMVGFAVVTRTADDHIAAIMRREADFNSREESHLVRVRRMMSHETTWSRPRSSTLLSLIGSLLRGAARWNVRAELDESRRTARDATLTTSWVGGRH